MKKKKMHCEMAIYPNAEKIIVIEAQNDKSFITININAPSMPKK
jgi:hypothetical protein